MRLQRSLRARTRKSDEWTTRVALRGCARAGKGGSRELIERQGPRALYTTGGVDGSRVPSDRPAARRRFLTGFARLRVPVPGQKWSVQARNGARTARRHPGALSPSNRRARGRSSCALAGRKSSRPEKESGCLRDERHHSDDHIIRADNCKVQVQRCGRGGADEVNLEWWTYRRL